MKRILPAALLLAALCADAGANVSLPSRLCSGSLVIMKGMPLSRKALVLTCGHCSGVGSDFTLSGMRPAAGEVLLDRKVSDTLVLRSASGRERSIAFRRLLFATMTGTDLALIELDESYEDLLRTLPGTEIRRVAETVPSAGTRTRVVSVQNQQRFSCRVETRVPAIREGAWSWTDFLRFEFVPNDPAVTNGCEFHPGVSGSGVIDTATGELVAVAQTKYSGGTPCAEDNPCEVGPGGLVSVARDAGQSYGAPTALLYSCFDPGEARFDFGLPGCALFRR